jgi:hypothetical protein
VTHGPIEKLLGKRLDTAAGLLDALSRHEAEIVALLRPGRDGCRPRTGSLMNGPVWPSSMAECRVLRPRRRHSLAASSNG